MTMVPPTSDSGRDPALWTPGRARALYELVIQDGDRRLATAIGWDIPVIEGELLKWFCFQCRLPDGAPKATGRIVNPGDRGAPAWADGHRWVPLSVPVAAKKFKTTEYRTQKGLAHLVEARLLLKVRARHRGHGTNWYRPNPAAIAALYDPNGEWGTLLEFPSIAPSSSTGPPTAFERHSSGIRPTRSVVTTYPLTPTTDAVRDEGGVVRDYVEGLESNFGAAADFSAPSTAAIDLERERRLRAILSRPALGAFSKSALQSSSTGTD